MKEIKAKIFNKLVDEIRKVKELEEQGYTIDGERSESLMVSGIGITAPSANRRSLSCRHTTDRTIRLDNGSLLD